MSYLWLKLGELFSLEMVGRSGVCILGIDRGWDYVIKQFQIFFVFKTHMLTSSSGSGKFLPHLQGFTFDCYGEEPAK